MLRCREAHGYLGPCIRIGKMAASKLPLPAPFWAALARSGHLARTISFQAQHRGWSGDAAGTSLRHFEGSHRQHYRGERHLGQRSTTSHIP